MTLRCPRRAFARGFLRAARRFHSHACRRGVFRYTGLPDCVKCKCGVRFLFPSLGTKSVRIHPKNSSFAPQTHLSGPNRHLQLADFKGAKMPPVRKTSPGRLNFNANPFWRIDLAQEQACRFFTNSVIVACTAYLFKRIDSDFFDDEAAQDAETASGAVGGWLRTCKTQSFRGRW